MKNKKILALALALLLTSLVSLPAFAEDGVNAELIVQKTLRTNVGTTIPDSTFYFQLNHVGFENDPDRMVHIQDLPQDQWVTRGSVSFDSTQRPTETSPGIFEVSGSSENLLENITWPRPGRYSFMLELVPNTNQLNNTPPVTEIMVYNYVVWGVHVWVRADAAGDLFVAAVQVFQADDEPYNEETTFGAKVAYAEFISDFVRKYDNYTSGPGEDERGLRVSKTVDGDSANPTTDFTFSAILTSPPIASEFRPSDQPETFTAIITGASGGDYGELIEFTSGVENTFQLRHGQSLQFNSLPVGTMFYIEEIDFLHYTPSITIIINGEPIPPFGPAGTGTQFLGEGRNYAAFLNTAESSPITGLFGISPPTLIIGVATIAVLALIVVSQRKRANE